MNTLEIRVQPAGWGLSGRSAEILIDGEDLLDRVRAVELPQATAQGQPEIAGAYRGVDPGEWADLLEPETDGRAAIYACGDCGEVGCWPLRVRIARSGGTVTWSDFQQPFRDWTYDGLGPFIFREDEYHRAVAAVSRV